MCCVCLYRTTLLNLNEKANQKVWVKVLGAGVYELLVLMNLLVHVDVCFISNPCQIYNILESWSSSVLEENKI